MEGLDANMSEKTDQKNKMEGKECEVGHGGVFYSCFQKSCMEFAPMMFKFLGLPFEPELLNPETQNVGTILVVMNQFGGIPGSLSLVHHEYRHYRDKKVIAFCFSIHESKDHAKGCWIENISPEGNITLFRVHQRIHGYIHECKGNQYCRETVQSMLGIVKQKDDQIHLQNSDLNYDALLNGLRHLVDNLQQRLSVKDFENDSSDLKNLSSGTAYPLVNMKNTEDKGTTGSYILKWFSDRFPSGIPSLRWATAPNLDHDTKEMLQKTEDFIKCLEKWKVKQSFCKFKLE